MDTIDKVEMALCRAPLEQTDAAARWRVGAA